MTTALADQFEAVLKPEHDRILDHLETWFGDALVGQIDIGWTDGTTGRLNRFPAHPSARSRKASSCGR